MKQRAKTETNNLGLTPQRTAFDVMMNVQCDLMTEVGLPLPPHWKKTHETPQWTKNICQKLKVTILRPILKLKPVRRKFSWPNYGRCIGILERFKTFFAKDVPRILKEEGLNRIGKKKWAKLQSILGEEKMRRYYLKILERPANDKTPIFELCVLVMERQTTNLERMKQIAFVHLADQSAKTTAMFLKGMQEGYSTFLNEDGEFSGDDRRVDIHLELIAWQYEIEKIRKLKLPVTRNKFFGNLKKLPEFKTRTQDWFNDVCKDIKLTGWKKGHPYKFSPP